MRVFRILGLLVVVGLLGLAAAGVYLAAVFGLIDLPFLRGPLPGPVDPQAVAQVNRKIAAETQDRAGFSLTLTETELATLLSSQLGSQAPLQELRVSLSPGVAAFTASLRGAVPVPLEGQAAASVEAGQLNVEVTSLSIGVLEAPPGARDAVQALVSQATDLNARLAEFGVSIQSLRLQPGSLTLVGVQRGGQVMAPEGLAQLQQALASATPAQAPEAPGEELPRGRVAQRPPAPGGPLYLSLGDSLAAGQGASTPLAAMTPRFHAFLEQTRFPDLGLRNLAVPGESTFSYLNGRQSAEATQVLQTGRAQVVSLSLGANDLLGHLGSPACQADPEGPACLERLEAAYQAFQPAYSRVLTQLRERSPGETMIVATTVYNPFNFGTGLPFERTSEAILDRFNSTIREVAARNRVAVADVHVLMGDRAAAWTHILQGDVHPNDDGHQALAWALAQTAEQQ